MAQKLRFLCSVHRQRRQNTPNTVGAAQSPKYLIPDLIGLISPEITAMFESETLKSTSNAAKKHFIEAYPTDCTIDNCYICNEL